MIRPDWGTLYLVYRIFRPPILTLNKVDYILLNLSYFYINFGKWFLPRFEGLIFGFCIGMLSLLSSALVSTLASFAIYFGVECMFREAFINRLLYLLSLFVTAVIFIVFSYDFFNPDFLRMHRSVFSSFSEFLLNTSLHN